MASIVREVDLCIREIDQIGKSKREARKKNIKAIHGKRQKQHTRSDSRNFAKWVRSEYGIKHLHQLSEEHYKSYLKYLEQRGISAGHRRNVETSLRLLQEGLNKRSERFGKEKVQFTPKKRITPSIKRGEGARNRSYTNQEIKALEKYISPSVRDSVALMRNLGLRVEESTLVRVEHFDLRAGKMIIPEGETVTKGGRFRVVPIPEHFKSHLEKMLDGKQPHERLVNVTEKTVRNGVNVGFKKAGIEQKGRGCHGFRHTYARERVAMLMTEQEKKLFDRCLDRYLEGKRADYGIFKPEQRELYNSMKKKMDQVHGELGHGKNRFDLAVRYMKN